MGRCAGLRGVLHTAASRLKPGGLLLTQHENFHSLSNLGAALAGKLPEDGVFLYDPEGLDLRIVPNGALTAALQREEMVLEKAISLTNDSWKPTAEKIVAVLGIQQGDEAVGMLLSLGKFNVWRKQS